jgi:hypothetical protein
LDELFGVEQALGVEEPSGVGRDSRLDELFGVGQDSRLEELSGVRQASGVEELSGVGLSLARSWPGCARWRIKNAFGKSQIKTNKQFAESLFAR